MYSLRRLPLSMGRAWWDRKPRLEVFSMWFENNNINSINTWFLNEGIICDKKSNSRKMDKYERYADSLPDYDWTMDNFFKADEKDPGYFKGRIFICDVYRFLEIYNSEKEHSIYTDLPMKKQKWVDSISGHTDLPGTTEQEVQYSVGSENNSEGYYKTVLPLMGPNAIGGVNVNDFFIAIFHRDSGDPVKDAKYASFAYNFYHRRNSLRYDGSDYWSIDIYPDSYDKPFLFKVDHAFRSLTLDCIVFRDSKAVRVDLKWIMYGNHATEDTDVYICGELAVVSDDVDYKKESFLFKTPPNKAIKVRNGMPIPLLKSVVAVPYHSAFTVKANLGRPNNVDGSGLFFPTVNSSASFPNVEYCDNETAFVRGYDTEGLEAQNGEDKGPKGLRIYYYKCTKDIHGTDGQIEVTVTVDLD